MELSRFFNSTPTDRRQYNAEEFAEFMATFYSAGVISGGDRLKVSGSASSLSVTVLQGSAMINGYWYCSTDAVTLPITAAHSQYPRIDRVVLRLDLTLEQRNIRLHVLTGTPALTPSAPALTRNTNIYELCLAQVSVPANAVIPGIITDKRYDAAVCGICQGLFSVDLSDFEEQQQEIIQDLQAQAAEAIEEITDMGNSALLSKIKEIDGSGSGVDADLLDGQHGSYYLNYNNLTNKPTLSSLGGQRKVLYGTSVPSSSLGQNGDLYIQYS